MSGFQNLLYHSFDFFHLCFLFNFTLGDIMLKWEWLLLFSCSVLSDSLRSCGLKHTKLPCPLLSPGACANSYPLCLWCYLTISFSATLFFFCLQSFPVSGSFPVSWLFASGGQSTGASASRVLPMNIQGWFPLRLTGLISLQIKGLSRVFSSTTIQRYQFFGAQPSLWSKPNIYTGLPAENTHYPDNSLR